MSDVKVTYFNGRGLGEVIRYLLKYGNIGFEDIRIDQDDWPTLKECKFNSESIAVNDATKRYT